METNKILNFRMIVLLGTLFLISGNVFAFAISSFYYEDHPLDMSSGETKEIELILQNLASEEDVTIEAEITKGFEFIQIVDESNTYLVPAGEKIPMTLRATIPLGIEPGTNYPVEITFKTIATGGSGEFALGSSIVRGFDIRVGMAILAEQEKEKKAIPWATYILILIILLIIIIVILMIRRKRVKYPE